MAFVAFTALGVAAEISAPGVGNFHQVDAHVYRGAQPTPEGFHSLAKLGVKTIVDLRMGSEHDGREDKVVEKEGMRYIHIPFNGFRAPTDDEVAKVMRSLDDSSGWPVFVHCKRGADRTGTVIACYRISHEHWDNAKALEEARLDGMSRLERGMQAYILAFKWNAQQALKEVTTTPAAVRDSPVAAKQ